MREPKRLLITGAGGLIGGACVKWFRANTEHTILACARSAASSGGVYPDCVCDLSREESIPILTKTLPNVVVHSAALIPRPGVEPDMVYQTNRAIDDNILRLVEACGAKLIYMSSAMLYRDYGALPVQEGMPIHAKAPYFQAKLESEERYDALGGVSLRITSPYGPGQKNQTVLKLFLERALAGEPITYYGTGERSQNFIFAEDIACAVDCAIRKDARGVYNIAASAPISMREAAAVTAQTVARVSGKAPVPVQNAQTPDPQEQMRANVCIEKAKTDLGWAPRVSFQDGMERWASDRIDLRGRVGE